MSSVAGLTSLAAQSRDYIKVMNQVKEVELAQGGSLTMAATPFVKILMVVFHPSIYLEFEATSAHSQELLETGEDWEDCPEVGEYDTAEETTEDTTGSTGHRC